jgi:hypothetical protein
MSARKRRSLLGGTPASGPLVASPGSEGDGEPRGDAAPIAEIPWVDAGSQGVVASPPQAPEVPVAGAVSPSEGPVGGAPAGGDVGVSPALPIDLAPGEQFEADLPPPVMSRARRRQQRVAAGWDSVKVAADAAPVAAEVAAAPAEAAATVAEPTATPSEPSVEPAPAGAAGERPSKAKSPFGDLKVVEYASGRKPATESPFFRAAPPEDAAVFVSSGAKAAAAAASPDALRFGRKLAGRATPPGRARAERPEAEQKAGHRDPMSWSEAIPEHNWSADRAPEAATPALLPTKRSVIADRPAVASVELVSPAQLPPVAPAVTKKPTPPPPVPPEKPPLELIQSASEPTLPGLLDEPFGGGPPAASPVSRPVRSGDPDASAEDAWLARPPPADEADDPVEATKGGIAPWMFAIPLGLIAVLLAAYLLLGR